MELGDLSEDVHAAESECVPSGFSSDDPAMPDFLSKALDFVETSKPWM